MPKINLKKKFDTLKLKFAYNLLESMIESFFSEMNLFKTKMLQLNANDLESVDSSERLMKQLQDEIIFLREKLRNKNNTIKYVLDQLSRRGGTVC